MAFGGQETQAGALAFEQRVGRDGRAVHDPVGLRQQRGAVEAEAAASCSRPSSTPSDGSCGRRRHLCERRRAALIDRDEIGKGAADIDADAVHAYTPTLTLPPQAGRGSR